MPANFTSADPHDVLKPPALDAPTPPSKPSGQTGSIDQGYAPSVVLPGNWWETWFDPTGPDRAEGLEFQAHTVVAFNYTAQWVRVGPANLWIPPKSLAWYIPIPKGSQIATLSSVTPPGATNGTVNSGQRCWVGYAEAYLPPSVGYSIPTTYL